MQTLQQKLTPPAIRKYKHPSIRRIFVLGCVGTSFLLQLVGTDSKTAGISKGLQIPLILGFQEGRKRPVGTRFCFAKSSVLYLLWPRVAQRGWSVEEQALWGGRRTGGFRKYQVSEFWIRSYEIRLPGCRWCSLLFLHHRGSKRYITLLSCLSNAFCSLV